MCTLSLKFIKLKGSWRTETKIKNHLPRQQKIKRRRKYFKFLILIAHQKQKIRLKIFLDLKKSKG